MSSRSSSLWNRARSLFLNAGTSRPAFESLESREVMAAVSWDGGAGTANWHDAANWSNDTIPGSADDVTIPATGLAAINFTATTGSRTINSLVCEESLSFTGGTLAVATTATSNSPISLGGGTLSGGAYTLTGGAAMTAVAGTVNILNNVNIAGEVLIPAGAIRLSGSTQFSAARLTGSSSVIQIVPGYTLNSAVVIEGAAAGTRTIQIGYGAQGNATIGASGSITLATSAGGGLTINDSSAGTLINNGLISADGAGQTLNINPNVMTNNGTLRVNAGTLNVAPSVNYTNPGNVVVNGGTLNLGSSFNATGGIGTWTRAGGTVNITGTITNTGSAFTLNNSTGSWNLLGGAITGGTVSLADGAGLVLTSSAGSLTSVAYGGDLNLPAGTFVLLSGTTTFNAARLTGASTLRVAPGATINSPVIAEGAAAGTRTILIAYGAQGNATIGTSGSIALATGAGGGLTINDSSAGTLINNGLISADGTGQTLNINSNVLTNNGTLRVNAGTLNVAPSVNYTSPGNVVVNGGTLNLGSAFNATGGIGTWTRAGGTVNITGAITNTGSTFTLNNSTGSWNLLGGGITGGTVTLADGAGLVLTSSAGTLTSVAYGGDLNLPAGTFVLLSGTTTFNAARLTGASTLRVAPGATINSPVIAEGAAAGTRTILIGYGAQGNATIGASGSITLATNAGGGLTITDSSAGTLINNGVISADGAGQTLTLNPNVVTNNGTLRVNAGTLNVAPSVSYTSPGNVVVNGGTLNLGSGFNATGGIGTWTRAGGTVNITGTITNTGSTFTLNSSTGSWNLLGGAITGGTVNLADGAGLVLTSSAGTLTSVAYGGDLNLPAGTFVLLSGTTTFNAARLTGASTLRVAPGATINSPVIAEGAAAGTRNVVIGYGAQGNATVGASGSITLATSAGGGLTINDSSAGTLINNGLISADGAAQTLNINSNVLTNNGTLRVNAGTLNVAPSVNYTSPGNVVVNGGTLNLGSSFNATGGIGTWTRAGGTVNITGTITNTGSTFTLNNSTGSWNLLGGGITGGTVNLADGAGLVLTSSAGTLTSVAYGGDLNLPAFTFVLLAGTTTFNAARLTGASTLRVAPGATINSPVIAEGAAAGGRNVVIGYGAQGNATIGASGSITLATGAGGWLAINDSSAGTLINNGLISADGAGQTLLINSNVLTNNGTLRVNAGTLWLASSTSYSNSGSIAVSGGTLNLDTTFTATAGIGTWDRTGGTVNVRGTINNAGSSFTLNSSTGSWNLLGGTISGGTVAIANGASLVFTTGGSLSGVTYQGDLLLPSNTAVTVSGSTRFNTARLSGPLSAFRFAPGYTLNDAVIAEGSASGTRTVVLAYGGSGTNTVGATGSIRLAPNTNGALNIDQSSNATLVNNGLISAEAAGRAITISTGALGNLAAGTLTGGTWIADNGATLNLGAGRSVVTNAATLRIEDAGSTISGLTGLAVNNGSFTLAGGRDLTLASLTNNGVLDLGPGSQITVNGAFTQSASATLNLTLGGNAAADLARITATGVATLAGSWHVGAVTSFPPVYGDFFDLVTGASRAGSFSAFSTGYVPAGVFVEFYSPTAARVAFDRRAGVWTGAGDGTTWTDAANWFNNTLPTIADTAYIGLPSSSPTIHLPAGAYVVGSVVSTEAFVIDVGATLNLTSEVEARFEGGFSNYGTLVTAQDVVALGGGTHDGHFVLSTGKSLSLGGTNAMTAQSHIEGDAAISIVGGATTFDGTLDADLAISISAGGTGAFVRDYTLDSLVNSGTTEIGAHSLTLSGAFTQQESGTLGVDLASEVSVGSIAAASATVAGTLSLTSSAGFDPSDPMLVMYGISVVTATTVSGQVVVGAQPDLVVGSYVARVEGNALRLLHNVADFNGDSGVDADDVITFFDAWDNGLILGDLNGDGGVDSDDVIFFFGLWDQGGR